MIDKEDISKLLDLHSKAYSILMYLADKSKDEPEILSAQIVEKLAEKKTCEKWIDENILSLPESMCPHREDLPFFAGLFSSFFVTSFKVDNLIFDGRVVDSTIKTLKRKEGRSEIGKRAIKHLALKHLCGSQNIRITSSDAQRMIRGKGIKADAIIWAYIWELDRRARGKAKGSSVHALWKDMPYETRKNLNPEMVWEARERLLAHVKNMIEESEQEEHQADIMSNEC